MKYYFGNLTPGGAGDPGFNSLFARTAQESFGSYHLWKADFFGVGKMRGVGWAICYQNDEWATLEPLDQFA